MTIVLSIAGQDHIVMAADSAVMLDFGESREYEQGRKTYMYPGVGCVSTWGSREANQVGRYLSQELGNLDTPSVEHLAELTFTYLTQEYRPDDIGLDNVGYHIGGFDSDQAPRLFHVFYGFDRPRPPDQIERKYGKYDHSPGPDGMFFLYNGRNDLAFLTINTFLREVSKGADTVLDMSEIIDRVMLADLVLRFASEITPQVAPPFITHVISPRNTSVIVRNDELIPLDRDLISELMASA